MNHHTITELISRDSDWRKQLQNAIKPSERTAIPRVTMPELSPDYRRKNNEEVSQGLTLDLALREATRCLDCPNPGCITGCPVNINIPAFIKNIQRGHLNDALRVLKMTSALPAVCGRVCPQERQCESRCIYLKMNKEPVGIGWLEQFAADHGKEDKPYKNPIPNPAKIAVVGSGPAGLSFAGTAAAAGHDVTVFEALHEIGGVLKYGIPEFRLPNPVVDREIDALRALGVTFLTDVVIGKTLSYDDLVQQGFKAIFVASGAGLPRFMGIEGENLNGIMSSNEYLTRINLMGAGRGGDTPVLKGHHVAVIGGGNTAMDSVRTALRMGAAKATIVYRRTEDEMPARRMEIHHAKEEGVEFMTLHNPEKFIGDDTGRVKSMILRKMSLGEPDESGRRAPVPIPGDEGLTEIAVDEVIVSVGVSPNPLIPSAFSNLDISKRGTIEVDDHMMSSIPMLFAGGDIVRGGATVILAMGDGRRAANECIKLLANPE